MYIPTPGCLRKIDILSEYHKLVRFSLNLTQILTAYVGTTQNPMFNEFFLPGIKMPFIRKEKVFKH